MNSISCGDELLDCPRLGGRSRNFNCAGRHDAVARQARGRSKPKTRKRLNTLGLTPPPRPGPGVTAAAAASDSDHLTTATLSIARHPVVWRLRRAVLLRPRRGDAARRSSGTRLPSQASIAGHDAPAQQRYCHFLFVLTRLSRCGQDPLAKQADQIGNNFILRGSHLASRNIQAWNGSTCISRWRYMKHSIHHLQLFNQPAMS